MHHVSAALVWAVLWDAQIVRWVVWVGLVGLTVALLLLLRTRWGQSQPLGKCVVLSLLAHLLVGIYTTTVNIVTQTVGSPDGKGIQVALVDSTSGDALSNDSNAPDSWDSLTGDGPCATFAAPRDFAPAAAVPDLPATAEPVRQLPIESSAPSVPVKLPSAPRRDDVGPPVFISARDPIVRPPTKQPEPIEMPQAEPIEPDPVPPPEPSTPNDAGGKPAGADLPKSEPSNPPAGGKGDPTGDPQPSPTTASDPAGADLKGVGSGVPKSLPPVYKQRVADHLQAAKGKGVTPESEARVTAALRWLAKNQSGGGRWDARKLSGGAARAADHEDRQAAGAQADTGITGLALLAFLAAGHTHQKGPYQTTVRRGLTYLQSIQDADGCLGVSPNRYERMYCHAMATCALSEAFAMTSDEWIGPAVRRAIRYTVLAQDRVNGGWRYHPGDPGDTSQLGWQVMALKSAELGGIEIPSETRDGIQRFLKSVSAGRSGGLARYQPNRGTVSRSMTAEALACRQFLGLSHDAEAIDEASSYVLQDLPGMSQTNVYYWYYATLAMHQLQGEPWRQWNEALQKNLLSTQRVDGDLAGSWDPDPVWGGCGGRAYSTALSALCLEVYYRFLPLYVEAAGRPKKREVAANVRLIFPPAEQPLTPAFQFDMAPGCGKMEVTVGSPHPALRTLR